VLAVLTVRARFDDPDLWWHLKTGEVIWTSHSIPVTDIFSYTTNHHASVPHEWLSQLLIYAAYKFGGYSGLMLWLCVFTAALLIAGYTLCSLYSGNAKVSLIGALTIWFFGTIGFAIRPHMVGYLLLIIELLLLHLGRTRNPRWFFGLVPLFAIWVNCHGSFFLGLAVAGALLFSAWFNFEAGSVVAVRWDSRPRNMLMLALGLSAIALLLNPVGIHQILYPLDTLLHQPVGLSQVSEWKPLQFGDTRALVMLAIPWGIFLLVARRSQLPFHELLWLALGTWLATGHRRMLFVFGILVAPIVARVLANSWENYDSETDRPLPNAVLVGLCLLVAFWAFPSLHSLQTQVDEHSPVRAVNYIESHHLSGNMINEWADGGYLIWAAPDHPVFIDGRADVFEWSGVIDEYGNWATLHDPPNQLLDKYHVSFCLLNRDSPMALVLPLLPNWKAVYSDDMSIVFVRSPAR